MEFCIWGCGVRGKNIFRFIGREHVRAFIDRDPALQGTEYAGVPVIGFERYMRDHRDCVVVVSPRYGHDELLGMLKLQGVKALSALMLPSDILETPRPELYDAVERRIGKGPVFLYGLNLYSILLLDHCRTSCPMRVIPEENAPEWLLRQVEECFPGALASLEEAGSNKLYITNGEYWDHGIPAERGVEIYDFLYDMKAYHNPELEKFKGIHAGRRCFIIGTGPSLRIEDLDRLRASGDICISMNGIVLAYDDTAWRPDYYLMVDRRGWEEWKGLLLGRCAVEHMLIADVCLENDSNPAFTRFHLSSLNISPRCPALFSTDFSRGAYESGTVTYACLQFAFYLGCTEIYLYGIDFNYADPRGHFTDAYLPVKLSEDLYEQGRAQLGYESARRKARELGVRIYNASRFTRLETFPRVDFDQVLDGGKSLVTGEKDVRAR